MNATLQPARASDSPIVREALLAAGAAAAVSAILVWAGPPGVDLAAHVYQRTLFLQHGLTLWNNFWYAGRYSFVTYSLVYYPLAALVGIRLLAVATIAAASLAFSVIVWREWGSRALWSSRTFAVVWAAIALSAAFPFALGAAFALLALWAAQARRLRRFAPLALLTLAASPVAFLLLALVLVGVGISRHPERRFLVGAGLVIGCLGFVELALWRLFPSAGIYPFSWEELAAVLVFCGFATVLTWRNERARALRFVFPVYAAVCVAAFAVPSGLGDNVVRLRFLAIPMAILVLALRDWRPLPVCVLALGLATFWNLISARVQLRAGGLGPGSEGVLLGSRGRVSRDPSVAELPGRGGRHRRPLGRRLPTPGRDPAGAGRIPAGRLSRERRSLRSTGAEGLRVLAAPAGHRLRGADQRAAGLQRRGGSATGRERPRAASTRVQDGGAEDLRCAIAATLDHRTGRRAHHLLQPGRDHGEWCPGPGIYRVAVRASPYWHVTRGCVTAGDDGMIRLHLPSAGKVRLNFALSASGALQAIAGSTDDTCS